MDGTVLIAAKQGKDRSEGTTRRALKIGNVYRKGDLVAIWDQRAPLRDVPG